MTETGKENARRLCFNSYPVCILDLTENLSLAEYQGIYGAGNFEEMTGGIAVEAVEEMFRADLLAGIFVGDEIFLQIMPVDFGHARDDVEFRPVAGRKDHRFLCNAVIDEVREEFLGLNFRKRDPFADFNGCGFMIDTN